MSVARVAARAVLAIGVLAVASSSFAREPTAEERRQARDLFSKAEKDEQGGDWRAALEKLERAGAVKMTPGIRFHIALCRENLGTLPEALADYEAAAAQARAENVAEVLEAVKEPLADLRARVPSLSLALVNASPESVEITVDDRAISAAELTTPLRLAAGTHRIVARRRAGGPPFSKDVELKERDVMALDLRLPENAPAASAASAASAAKATPSGGSAAFIAPPSEAPTRSRVGAIAATAGAIVLVGGGVVAFVLAGNAQDDLRSCTTRDDCESKRQPVRTLDALALGGWISGAALGALATVLWLQPTHAGVAFGGNRAALVGRF